MTELPRETLKNILDVSAPADMFYDEPRTGLWALPADIRARLEVDHEA